MKNNKTVVKAENKVWTLIAPIVVLFAICLVITTALAFTNYATAPVIKAAQSKAADAAMQVVLPEGSDFAAIEGELPANITAASRAGNGAGYVLTADAKGFGGGMSVMVGLSSDGKITGTRVLVHAESAGIGTKVVDDDSPFQQQLIGMGDTSGVQATASATVSSNGVKAAIQSIFDAYTVITGGTVEVKVASKPGVLTDGVMEQYYPGVAFTEVPGGMVSDAGTVVFGEAQGMQSVVRTAVFFDGDGKILGLVSDTLGETEYIGDVIGQNTAFTDLFKGAADVDSIAAVSGATITSTAVKDGVKQAIANLETVKGAA